MLSIAQGANGWLALPEFQDAVFWMDSFVADQAGATTIQMNFETSPVAEDVLFLPMCSLLMPNAVESQTTAFSSLLNQNPAVPLATWVRWRVSVTGTLTRSWRVTFRIRVAANATTKFYLRS